jgi:hypothetical protein
MVHRRTLIMMRMYVIDYIAMYSVDEDDDAIHSFFFDVKVDYIIVVRYHAQCPNNCSHPIISS